MTKLSSTPAGAVLVAIDMAKYRQEELIERPEGGRRRRIAVLATKADYDGLAEQLGAIGRPIVVGSEVTGNYHRTFAHRLLTARFELRLISSVAPARTREAFHNGWDKNDPKDAQVILHSCGSARPSGTAIRSPQASTICRSCRRLTRRSPG